MTEVMEQLRNNLTVDDVKCRTELNVGDSAPVDAFDKLERKKKTRRRKTKRKNPYTKQNMAENIRGGKKNIRIRTSGKSSTYEQPVAPYNSNQFLIEDHNDLQDFDMKLMAAANRVSGEQETSTGPQRTGRVRDPSFTSADSDDDFFYSSPEDEEEFLAKEFSNTYRDLHVEGLASMSKAELIQNILQLEDKVDTLEKIIGTARTASESDDKSPEENSQIRKLAIANQKLLSENARLRDEVKGKCCSSSSEDSESDSTSSSESSDMNTDEDDDESTTPQYQHMNGDVHKENDINMDPTDNT